MIPNVFVVTYPKAEGAYYALGYGGQYIFVLPNLNMVVVFTAGDYVTATEFGYNILFAYILNNRLLK